MIFLLPCEPYNLKSPDLDFKKEYEALSRMDFKVFLYDYDQFVNYNEIVSLAEFKWMRFGIVCQKKYEPVYSIPKRVVKRLKEKIPEFNFDNCDLYNYENWGKDGKKYILLDYGINENISKLYNKNKQDE
jgi:hypothetical protein